MKGNGYCEIPLPEGTKRELHHRGIRDVYMLTLPTGERLKEIHDRSGISLIFVPLPQKVQEELGLAYEPDEESCRRSPSGTW